MWARIRGTWPSLVRKAAGFPRHPFQPVPLEHPEGLAAEAQRLPLTLELPRLQGHPTERTPCPFFVLGHSWGSYLGLELARQHPSWLHAYIGVGQLTGPESERRGWRFAVDAAHRAGNAEAVGELQAIAPYFAPGRTATLEDIYTQRRWLDFSAS